MYHAHMSSQCVVAGESLFFRAQVTSDLLLAPIVNGVLVPRQIVRPREDRVAGLARAGVDPITAVRTSL